LCREALQAPPHIDTIVGLAVTAATTKAMFLKESGERTIRRWIQELPDSVRYVGTVGKKIQDSIGALRDIDEQQKEKVWNLIQRFLTLKPEAESVPPVS
jgi:hypothetical protein